jgi:FAD/FMN-containing dehydrogenase
MAFDGPVFWRGDEGYEEARLQAVWNARKPDRYPDVIVRAHTEADVIAAVQLAAEHDLQVKARGGGHSWTASSVREGLLIDLSLLTDATFDPRTGRVSAQPGITGNALNAMLAEHERFFPTGHCPSIGIGGFLLQGGWGWNSRALGPGCVSVAAVDVVTAAGELVHATETENADYLWAARGAGSGYFGIVTRFELKTHPRPTAIYTRTDVYSVDDVDAVLRWAMAFEPTVPAEMEFAIMATTPTLPDGTTVVDETALMIMCMTLMYDDDAARAALARLDECPVFDHALHVGETIPTPFSGLYDLPDSVEPEGVRWAVDNMWTNAGPDELVPRIAALIRDVRTPESHIFWMPWRVQDFGDVALSIQANLYIAAFAGWHDPADDAFYAAWPVEHMRELEDLSEGIQLADENLIARPESRCFSPEAQERMERLRAQYDPDGRFHSYLVPEGV